MLLTVPIQAYNYRLKPVHTSQDTTHEVLNMCNADREWTYCNWEGRYYRVHYIYEKLLFSSYVCTYVRSFMHMQLANSIIPKFNQHAMLQATYLLVLK